MQTINNCGYYTVKSVDFLQHLGTKGSYPTTYRSSVTRRQQVERMAVNLASILIYQRNLPSDPHEIFFLFFSFLFSPQFPASLFGCTPPDDWLLKNGVELYHFRDELCELYVCGKYNNKREIKCSESEVMAMVLKLAKLLKINGKLILYHAPGSVLVYNPDAFPLDCGS